MPYFFGALALLVLYFFSIVFTRSFMPWALAYGKNEELSCSQFQFLIFTALIVFCYTTTCAAWFIKSQSPISLPEIPINLLILMGFSIATTSGSKGITISYLQQEQILPDDKSNLFLNRDGVPDLNKVQMLIWTIIAVCIYLYQFIISINTSPLVRLPDFDKTLLILMGISQGGYIGGKLVQKNVTTVPIIEFIAPDTIKINSELTVFGGPFNEKEGNTILITDQNNNISEVPSENIMEWSDSKIRLKITKQYSLKKGQTLRCYLQVRVNGINSKVKEFKITA